MDIRMPSLDGIEATRRIAGGDRSPRILILTTFDLDEYVYEALRAGASGFLLKDAGPARLLDAIRVVASGDALLDPAVTRRLIAQFAQRPDVRRAQPEELSALTERERAALLGGECQIDPRAGGGAQLCFRLPLVELREERVENDRSQSS